MLAGAVNRCDDLFIHTGFCALQAMSKTGQSRPFHAGADGLVPAEGAGFVVLERLEDALAAGRTIHGVIRGVGLSNDGRGRGFLAPSAAGQAHAMRGAWKAADLDPATANLIECHATGTVLGDATELDSMAQVFSHDLPIGSLKSNLGHLITTAGVAGLLKVLRGIEVRQRFATLHVDHPNPALDSVPFRVLTQNEPWEADGPLRAGINAFDSVATTPTSSSKSPVLQHQLPLRSLHRRWLWSQSVPGWGRRPNVTQLADALQQPDPPGRTETITLELPGLRFPPRT